MARLRASIIFTNANAERHFRKLGETAMTESWTNVYRTGGTHNAKWQRAFPLKTEAEARAQALEIERQGYKTHTNTTEFWNTIGLPVGFCSHCDPMTGEYRNCGCAG
jgi:hypothetical protein